MQPELSFVVIDYSSQVFPPGLIERQQRLQGLDREPLGVADALQVAAVSIECRLYGRFGDLHLPLPRLDLGAGLDHLPCDRSMTCTC